MAASSVWWSGESWCWSLIAAWRDNESLLGGTGLFDQCMCIGFQNLQNKEDVTSNTLMVIVRVIYQGNWGSGACDLCCGGS